MHSSEQHIKLNSSMHNHSMCCATITPRLHNCSINIAHSISLKINCGYARVAIRSLSEIEKGKHHCEISQHTRAQKFRKLFASSFALPNSYFEEKGGRTALFN